MNAVTDSAKYAAARENQSELEAQQETLPRDYRDALDSAGCSLERIETALQVLHNEDGEDAAHTMTLCSWALQECAKVRQEIDRAYNQGRGADARVLPRETDPDVVLKTLIAEHEAADKEAQAIVTESEKVDGAGAYHKHSRWSGRYQKSMRRAEDLLDRIKETPATSLGGVVAKLRLAFFGQDLTPEMDVSDVSMPLGASAMTDLARLARSCR